MESYDHTYITSRPVILIQAYSKKSLFITIIHLWDVMSDSLLLSRHDPVKIRDNEAEIDKAKIEDGAISPRGKSSKRENEEGLGLHDVFKSVIEICRDDGMKKIEKPCDILIE